MDTEQSLPLGLDDSKPPLQKIFIKTYGCQMNVYDSQRISDNLQAHGYELTEIPQEADFILVNTCHIREKASEKLYSDLGRLRALRDKRLPHKPLKIGVAGCVAQAEGEEILRRAPVVDWIIGPQTYHRLPSILKRVALGEKIIDIDYAVEDKFKHLADASRTQIAKRGVAAFLTVQEGCDKFCTFCVVPYTRGAENSRTRTQILQEAQNLVAAGVKEITLLGQNVNAWHGLAKNGQEIGLAELLFELAELQGLKRLRYTTSHPCDMDENLIAAHRDLPALMPYLHLPVQSGSDKILKAMNRQHKASDYLQLIDKIRSVQPEMAFSGDFIVGFPGETKEDFKKTLSLIDKVGYSSAYSFKYSPRPGTPGAEMLEAVEENEKNDRLQELQALLSEQQTKFLQSKIGTTTTILVERKGRHVGQMIGRSPWLLPVTLQGTADIGAELPVVIEAHSSNSFFARPIQEKADNSAFYEAQHPRA